MKKIIAVLLAAVLVLSLVGCGSSSSSSSSGSSAPAGSTTQTQPAANQGTSTETQTEDSVPYFRIGAMCYAMYEEASSYMIAGMQKALDEYEGVDGEIVVYDPEGDISKQVAGVEEFISAGLDGLVISAVDSLGIRASLDRAQESGMVVVPFDLDPEWENAPCVVVADDFMGGYVSGKALCEKLVADGVTEGLILIQRTRPSVTACVIRAEGYAKAIEEYPQFTYEYFTADPGGRAGWLATTENMLQAHPETIAVCCFDGDSSMAGVLAVESQGREDSVLVTGYFPGMETTQACIDGRMMGLTDSDCEYMAYIAVTRCIDLLLGKTVEPKIQTDVHYIDADGCRAWQEAHS